MEAAGRAGCGNNTLAPLPGVSCPGIIPETQDKRPPEEGELGNMEACGRNSAPSHPMENPTGNMNWAADIEEQVPGQGHSILVPISEGGGEPSLELQRCNNQVNPTAGRALENPSAVQDLPGRPLDTSCEVQARGEEAHISNGTAGKHRGADPSTTKETIEEQGVNTQRPVPDLNTTAPFSASNTAVASLGESSLAFPPQLFIST
jgi:hypothetical protein